MGKTTPTHCLTAENAKTQVLAHWQYLEKLALQRFPKDENMGHEALLFVLQHLETDQWRRIRSWPGQGQFIAYLTVITNRLLTDFSRKQFGHLRKPLWLINKQDDLWNQAFHVLKVQHYTRQESIEILCCSHPQRTRSYIENMIRTLLQKCKDSKTRKHYQPISIDSCPEPGTLQTSPEQLLGLKELDVLEILLHFLNQNNSTSLPEHLIEPLQKLQANLSLNEEDRLLLQLRYLDGFTMKAIVKAMNLQGDPYKRYHKLVNKLRQSFLKTGLITVESVPF